MKLIGYAALALAVIGLLFGSLFLFTDFLVNNDTDTDVSGSYDEEDPTTTVVVTTSLSPGVTTTTPLVLQPYLTLQVWGTGYLLDPNGHVVQRHALRETTLAEKIITTWQFIFTVRIRSNKLDWDTISVANWVDIIDVTTGEFQQCYWQQINKGTEFKSYLREAEWWQSGERTVKGDLTTPLYKLSGQGINFFSSREVAFVLHTQVEGFDINGNPVQDKFGYNSYYVGVGFKAKIHTDESGRFYATENVVDSIGGYGGRSIVGLTGIG